MAVRVWGQLSEWEIETYALRELVEALEQSAGNFDIVVSPIVGTRAGREIDLLILTETTISHIELKACVNGKVVVRPNGRWECDGRPQTGQNPLDQLRKQYLSLVDWLTANSKTFLRGSRAAQGSRREAWYSIRSFLVFWPCLNSEHSNIDTSGYEQYLTPTRGGVIGFDELPSRLTDPCYQGNTPRLDEESILKIVRCLGLDTEELALRDLFSISACEENEETQSGENDLSSRATDKPHDGRSREPNPLSRKRVSHRRIRAIASICAVIAVLAGLFAFRGEIFNSESYVLDIPDKTLYQGQAFPEFNLDDYAETESEPASVNWRAMGNSHTRISIDENRHVTIVPLDPHWYGSEKITFRATFPSGAVDEDHMIVQIKGPVLATFREFDDEIDSGRQVYILFELDSPNGVKDYGSGNTWAFSTKNHNDAAPDYDVAIHVLSGSKTAIEDLLRGCHYVGPFEISDTEQGYPMIQCTLSELQARIAPSEN